MGWGNPVVGGTALLRQAIRNPGFITGVTGWSVNQDGSAEFNNVVIRNGQIISGFSLTYSGPPAFGNLIESAGVTVAGTDAFGNAYLTGDTVYTNVSGTYFAAQLGTPGGGLSQASLAFYVASGAGGPYTRQASLNGDAGGNLATILPSGGSLFTLTPLSVRLEVVISPSGDATGVTDTANLLNALPGPYIRLLPGTYYIKTGQISIDQFSTGPVCIEGPGIELCTINLLGSGDGIRWFHSGTSYLPGGGKFTGVTLDGAGLTGVGSSLLHIGDLYNFELDIAVQNAPSTALGVWLDNQYLFMEQLHGRIHVHQCGNPAVRFDNSANHTGSATGSFDRCRLEIMLDQKGRGDCVVLLNGAFITDGYLTISGNTDYGSVKYWVLTLSGSNAGGQSRITQSILNIGVECNATVGTQPGTIHFITTGPSGNQIFRCDGLIDFSGNNLFAVSNNDHSFYYAGETFGDNALPSSGPVSDAAFKHGALANNDTIQTKFFRVIEVVPAANVTGIIMDAFAPDDWRRVTVMNNSAFTITFAAAGVSHVASGVACVIGANVCQDFEYNPDINMWFAVRNP